MSSKHNFNDFSMCIEHELYEHLLDTGEIFSTAKDDSA